jgi:hypothetical protein
MTLWCELAPEDRRAWLSVALWSREYRRQGRPDAPARQAFTLDGRHIEVALFDLLLEIFEEQGVSVILR